MRKTGILFLLVAMVVALAGCQSPGQWRAGVAAANVAADAAYGAVYQAWQAGRIDEPTKDQAAALYDDYYAAANAVLDAVLIWEAVAIPGASAPGEVVEARDKMIAILLQLQAFAAQFRGAAKPRASPPPAPPGPARTTAAPRYRASLQTFAA